MHPWLAQYTPGWQPTGDIKSDVIRFLAANHSDYTDQHCLRVGAASRGLAETYGADPDQAELAGWLHDISKVIPNRQRLEAAAALGLEILPEEAAFPMILHQKLSVEIARQLFHVHQPEVLSAIGCHTTLKPDAALLDQVVFLADKLEWDGEGMAPYLPAVLAGLQHSLERGVFAYLDYIWQQRSTLRCLHPWLAAAHRQLAAIIAA
ncbi:MAG: bis(5'-nucleosyl)-tetraphosphatase (symmetrical) YqeK [Anaerolineales bacterium]|jgi:predicted HD superfamily hydrolase involved in NAD metabolism|nr:bis(5'-nucleosyl)-tetraphosphatase (symmetrical) YqeK [Anaerolineales bacterium]